MATLLPKKTIIEVPIATDDDVQAQLIADPTIKQFPGNNDHPYLSTGPTTFGSPSPGGFSPSISYNPSASSGFGGSSTGGAYTNQSTTNLTQGGSNAAQGADVLVANDNTDFINKKWRPLMAFVYMFTCLCDFVLFPVLWSLLQAMSKGTVTVQWQPLTLQGAGLYHIAMGAVLGVAAYGRTKEKISGTS